MNVHLQALENLLTGGYAEHQDGDRLYLPGHDTEITCPDGRLGVTMITFPDFKAAGEIVTMEISGNATYGTLVAIAEYIRSAQKLAYPMGAPGGRS